MRKRIDQTGVDRKIGVEIMRQLDPVGLGDEAQQFAIGVERPGPATLLDFEPMLVVAVKHGLRDRAVMIAVDDADRLIADPIDRNDLHRLRGSDAANRRTVLYVFEPRPHYPALPPCVFIAEAPPSLERPRFPYGLL
ncbi:hypothetical protein [Sphingosinicella ginsenosidimutans]|uniref:hypothetical protein n=1 Tax=Allosphingosinicella ginsenosidimutans TaxID=1176539 RepID=UPI001FB11A1D